MRLLRIPRPDSYLQWRQLYGWVRSEWRHIAPPSESPTSWLQSSATLWVSPHGSAKPVPYQFHRPFAAVTCYYRRSYYRRSWWSPRYWRVSYQLKVPTLSDALQLRASQSWFQRGFPRFRRWDASLCIFHHVSRSTAGQLAEELA